MTENLDTKKLSLGFQVNLAVALLSVISYSDLSYTLFIGATQLGYIIGSQSDFFIFGILLLWVIWLVASALGIFFVSWRRPATFLGAAFVLFGVLLVSLLL